MKKTNYILSAALIGTLAFSSCKKEPVPAITASATSVQVGEPVVFSFTEDKKTTKNTSITYDFGDGTSSETNERNVSHVYSRPGTYTVTQTMSANKDLNKGKGMYASTTATVEVKGATAAFSASPSAPKVGETVTFSNSTTDGDKGYVLNYNWWAVSADGNSISLGNNKNAKATFNQNSTWVVYLEVSQGWDHKSTATQTVTVGTGTSNATTLNKFVGTWNFNSTSGDVMVLTVVGSAGTTGGCSSNNGSTTVNPSSTSNIIKADIDAAGNISVFRTSGSGGGADQVDGDSYGSINATSNSVVDISGSWGGTYRIKTITSSSMVLESEVTADNPGGSNCGTTTTIRTLTFSK